MLARGETEGDTAGDEIGSLRTGRCRKEEEKKIERVQLGKEEAVADTGGDFLNEGQAKEECQAE
jgi:hypothetical protein